MLFINGYKVGRHKVIKVKKEDKPIKEVKADKPLTFTPKQLSIYSKRLAELPALGSNAPIGATTESYAASIAIELTDNENQKKYIKYLDKLGFKVA